MLKIVKRKYLLHVHFINKAKSTIPLYHPITSLQVIYKNMSKKVVKYIYRLKSGKRPSLSKTIGEFQILTFWFTCRVSFSMVDQQLQWAPIE
jgi:hypothetical protein